MHGLLASSYQMTGGASCRIHTDHPLHVIVTEQDTDGRTRFTHRLVPVGDHVVRSVFRRAECVYVSVRDQGDGTDPPRP
jgi:hypothetical protein